MTALPNPGFHNRMWTDAPAFMGLGLFIVLTALPLLAAATLDSRIFLDAPVWQKPLQFHLALSVYIVTLAFFARYLPAGMTENRVWRWYVAAVCVAIIAELVWVGGAASFGIASHFNTAEPVMGAIYGLMGLLAVLLTSASVVMGVAIWRNPATGLAPALHLSVAVGLVLTFALTLIAAGTMAATPGHFVGIPMTGARLPVVGWSREVGDLRVPHFFATHALHVLPIIGLIAARTLTPAAARVAVWGAATAFAGLVALTLAQAQAGLPFLPWLG